MQQSRFDGSTYVRTVRTILAKKGIAYTQVPVNVLTGETPTPEHLARHPFGKVPVLDIDGMRLRETEAICRYLDDRTPEPSVVPVDAKDRALMTEVINMIGSYGYNAMLGGVAAYHLFPDFVGGKNEEARAKGLKDTITLLTLIMEIRGDRTWIVGSSASIADYLLGPLMFYLSLTSDMPALLAVPGVAESWATISGDSDFAKSAPNLG
ncbi:MAG: glutathione S-transferase family protein [Candidatus Saccharibacteria bacterium]|nr:glutathione S-transferase family protein [Pseudorhodobacter sp.]